MSLEHSSLTARVAQLEAQVTALLQAASRVPARPAVLGAARPVRLARTARLEGDYEYPPPPASGSDGSAAPASAGPTGNTFGIIFLDVTYTADETGQVTPEITQRQLAARTTAQTIDGSYVAEGTIVIVFYDNRRWFIVKGGGGGGGGSFSLCPAVVGGVRLDISPIVEAAEDVFSLGLQAGCLVQVGIRLCGSGGGGSGSGS